MANEITYSNAGDQRTTNILARELWALNHDPTDIRQIIERVTLPLDGSSITKVPQMGQAYALAAPGEQTAPSNSAMTDGSFSLTVARYALKFNPTDLAQITSQTGGLLIDRLVQVATGAIGQTMTDLITALFSSLNVTAGGGAAVDFRVSDHFDGIYALHNANARIYPDGGFKAVYRHHSVNELINALRSEVGPLQWRDDVKNLMGAGMPGFRARFAGVDIFSVDSVVEGSGIANNAMFGRYCFAYGIADPAKVVRYIDRAVKLVDGGVGYITTTYTPGLGDWDVITNLWPAVAEAEDDEGVLITSDDT